jgi:hypothetical protein
MEEPPVWGWAVRGTGVPSAACESGLLEELDEPEGFLGGFWGWARSVGESARPAARTTLAMGGKVGKDGRLKEDTIRVRRSH